VTVRGQCRIWGEGGRACDADFLNAFGSNPRSIARKQPPPVLLRGVKRHLHGMKKVVNIRLLSVESRTPLCPFVKRGLNPFKVNYNQSAKLLEVLRIAAVIGEGFLSERFAFGTAGMAADL
jgi:hypothetical protein